MNRLQQTLASMVELESRVESAVDEALARGVGHPDARQLIERIQSAVRKQHATVTRRLEIVGGDANEATDDEFPASSSIRALAGLLNEAVFGYTILQPLAHRYRDSKITGEADNTGDIVELHLNEYTTLAQELNQLVHEVVLWEQNEAGEECRCTCPSCGLGICLCAVSSRTILNESWAETVPAPSQGFAVRTPRTGSEAAAAGLRDGDVVLTANDAEIGSYRELQGIVRESQPGGTIKLQVQRGSGEPVELEIAIPATVG